MPIKAIRKPEPDPITPETVATECMEQAGGDWRTAANLMRRHIDADAALFRELMTPMVDQAIWALIRGVSHRTRQAYKCAARGQDDASGLKVIAGRQQRAWMEYPLSGGLRLGDADAMKLLEEAAMHEALAHGNAAMAAFYKAVKERIGERKVAEALSEQQLTALAAELL